MQSIRSFRERNYVKLKVENVKYFKVVLVFISIIQGSLALAENYEVKMLNTGADGVMVFEPAMLKVELGDSVTFKSTNPGHNSASIAGMIPEGAEGWNGGMSADVTVNFETEGVYVYQCTPHMMMAMVGVIQVGSGDNLVSIKAKAAEKKSAFVMSPDRLDSYLNQL
jgi:pseudoazurin|tara:strand:- start:89 stop:589 length:501 start_codon:yes stop_codon:yes gene_type:complete